MSTEIGEQSLNPEWQQKIEGGLLDALENFVLFDNLVNISPTALSEGEDERIFQDLSPAEQEYIKGTLFNALAVDPEIDEVVRTYEFTAPEPQDLAKHHQEWSGVAKVKVYQTSRSKEGLFLHIVQHPDGKTEYVVTEKDRDL